MPLTGAIGLAAVLVAALLAPDEPRLWPGYVPGFGQPAPTLAELDARRRLAVTQAELDRALAAPRLIPWLEAERARLLEEDRVLAALLADSAESGT